MYELKVTKTDNFNLVNTNLETLAIENYLIYPPFENSITEYTIQISNDEDSLNIFAVPENEQGKVEIYGNYELNEGNNIINVIVTAPNGINKREYKINAYKRNINEEMEYKKQIEAQEQKLQEAYEIEKTSTNNSKLNKQKEIRNIVVGTIALIITILLFKKVTGYLKR